MLDFNNKVSQFLKEHKKSVRMRALAVVMSLAVVLSVCGSLIMPAISASKDGDNGGLVVSLGAAKGDKNYLNDFASNVTTEGLTEDTTSATASVNISFLITADEAKQIVAGTEYFYTLPEDVTAATTYTNVPIYDETYTADEGEEAGTHIAGYFTVYSDGTIGITYTSEYVNEVISTYATNNQSFPTSISFNAQFSRDESQSNVVSYNFGTSSNPVSLTINYQALAVDVDKSAGTTTISSDGKTATTEWTVVLTNNDNVSLNGYTLTDSLLADATNITVSPSNAVASISSGTITFAAVTDTTITITYTTTQDVAATSTTTVTNTATLTPADTSESPTSGTAQTSIPAQYTVSKSGVNDYSSANSTYADVNGEIEWTITITSLSGDFDGITITDAAFSDADALASAVASLEAIVGSGNISTNGTTITISNYSNTSGELTFSYTTTGNQGQSGNNTVTVADPTENWETSKSTWYNYNPSYDIGKTAVVDSINNTITYTIKVTGTTSLRGMTIEDAMFADANPAITDGTGYTYNSGVITITSDVKEFTFTYTIDAVVGQTYTNTAYLKYDNNELDEATTTNELQDVEETTKTVGTVSVNGSSITISWTVTYTNTDGVASQTITDTTSTDDTNNAVTHYYDQTTGVTITYVDTNSQTQTLDSSLYTVTYSPSTDATSMTIEFDSSVASSIKEVTITYNTIADVTNVADSSQSEVSFINTANGVSASYTYNNAPFTKSIYSETLSSTSSTNVDDLEVVNISGTDYYVFTWVIELDSSFLKNINSGAITLTDTLPTGFSMYGDVYLFNSTNWGVVYGYDYPNGWNYSTVYYTTNGQDVTFNVYGLSGTNSYLVYSTIVSVDDLETAITNANGSYDVTNTIASGSYEIATAGETVNEVVNNSVLSKSSSYDSNSSNPNLISYSIDVNPDASDLVTGNTITLNDVFSVSSSEVSATIDSMKIYSVDDQGNKIELSSSEYTYSISSTSTPVTQTVYSQSGTVNPGGSSGDFYIDVRAGDVITVSSDNDWSVIWVGDYYDQSNPTNYYTTTATSDGSYKTGLSVWGNGNTINYTITVTRVVYTYDITITVPDEMHLEIDYSLLLNVDATHVSKETYYVSNTVGIDSNQQYENSEKSDTMSFAYYATGQAGGGSTNMDVTATKVWNDTVTDHSNYSVTVTLYRTITPGSNLTEVTEDVNGATISSTATLSSSNNWSAEWEDLALTDGSNNTYYYYIYETEVSDGTNTVTLSTSDTSYILGSTTYDVTYDNNSLTTTGTITITNTDSTITSYTLPNTGSTGVGNYLIGGGAISITALALMRIKKRKNK